MSDQQSPASPALSKTALFAYAGPQFTLFLARAAGYGIIPALYAERFDLTLDKIAGVLLFMRFVEALLQVLAGKLTDKTAQGPFGRKTWVVLGSLMAALALIMLYSPPSNAGLFYLAFWLCLGTLVGSVAEVAYFSWGAEITNDYAERGKVATVQQWAAIAGQLGFFGIPLLPLTPTTEVTFESLGFLAWGVGVLTPLLMIIAVKSAPRGNPGTGEVAPTFRSLITAIFANRPMQILILGAVFFDLAASVSVGVGFLFLDSFLKGGSYVAYQGLLQMGGAFLGVSLTSYLITRLQKHHVWAASTWVYAAVLLPALFLTASTPYAGAIYVALTTTAYFVIMGAVVSPMSIIGDVVDYERWRSGEQQSGQFVAAFTLTQKLVGGLTAALGFYLLSLFGFEPGQEDYGPSATFGIRLVAIVMPAALMAFSGLIAWRFPLNKRRHAIVLKRLKSRDARLEATRSAS
ncbi:MAG: MFS transporter [Pseudomonadota bacterium]